MSKGIGYYSENIQNYLNAKKLSISQLANQSKVQMAHIQKCINNGSSKLKNAEKLANAMNVDIDSLLFKKIEFERIE